MRLPRAAQARTSYVDPRIIERHSAGGIRAAL